MDPVKTLQILAYVSIGLAACTALLVLTCVVYKRVLWIRNRRDKRITTRAMGNPDP